MRKTEYNPQAIRSISAFDSHKKQLIALLQKDITGRDTEESSDDTMKKLSICSGNPIRLQSLYPCRRIDRT